MLLAGPLQPWQILTLLSESLTKVIRTSVQVTTQIAFKEFLKEITLQRSLSSYLDFFIDVSMPLRHYVDARVYKWPFHHNPQDFCVSLVNRYPENAESVSIL